MMQAYYVKQWINSLPDDAEVSIDDGGLQLCTPTGAYLEVGGQPESEYDEPELRGDKKT